MLVVLIVVDIFKIKTDILMREGNSVSREDVSTRYTVSKSRLVRMAEEEYVTSNFSITIVVVAQFA